MFQCQPFIYLKDKKRNKWSDHLKRISAELVTLFWSTPSISLYRINIYDIVLDALKWWKIKKKKCKVLDYWTNGSLYVWYTGWNSKLNNLICIIIKIFWWKPIYFCFGCYHKHIQYNFQWIYFRCMIWAPNWILKTIFPNLIKREEKKAIFINISLSKIHPFFKSMFRNGHWDFHTSFIRKETASLKGKETRENNTQNWIEKIFQSNIDRTICKSHFIEILRRSIGYWYSLISLFHFKKNLNDCVPMKYFLCISLLCTLYIQFLTPSHSLCIPHLW